MGSTVIDLQQARRRREQKGPRLGKITNPAATPIAEVRYATLHRETAGRRMVETGSGISSGTSLVATKDIDRVAKLEEVAKLAQALVVGAPEWLASNPGVVEVPLGLIIDMRLALGVAGYDMTEAYRNYDVLGRRAVEGARLRIERRFEQEVADAATKMASPKTGEGTQVPIRQDANPNLRKQLRSM
jgi:hypothetical protein